MTMRTETREKLIGIREELMLSWQRLNDPKLYELYQRLWNTLEVDRLQEEQEHELSVERDRLAEPSS